MASVYILVLDTIFLAFNPGMVLLYAAAFFRIPRLFPIL